MARYGWAAREWISVLWGEGVIAATELKVGRETRLTRGPRDHYRTGCERFALGLKHASIEFRRLDKKRHAVVGGRDLARCRVRTATNHRDGRGGMLDERWPKTEGSKPLGVTVATSTAAMVSFSAIGGKMPASRWASMLLPALGGPISSSLRLPAAAIASAHLVRGFPERRPGRH